MTRSSDMRKFMESGRVYPHPERRVGPCRRALKVHNCMVRRAHILRLLLLVLAREVAADEGHCTSVLAAPTCSCRTATATTALGHRCEYNGALPDVPEGTEIVMRQVARACDFDGWRNHCRWHSLIGSKRYLRSYFRSSTPFTVHFGGPRQQAGWLARWQQCSRRLMTAV